MSASTIFHLKRTALTFFRSCCFLFILFVAFSLYHSLVFIAFATLSTKHESRIAYFNNIMMMITVEERKPLPQIIYLSLSLSLDLFSSHYMTNTIKPMLWKYLSNFRNGIRFEFIQVNLYIIALSLYIDRYHLVN